MLALPSSVSASDAETCAQKLRDWRFDSNITGVRDGRLQLAILLPPLKANALAELRFQELALRVLLLPFHPTIRSRGDSRFHWLRRRGNRSLDSRPRSILAKKNTLLRYLRG